MKLIVSFFCVAFSPSACLMRRGVIFLLLFLCSSGVPAQTDAYLVEYVADRETYEQDVAEEDPFATRQPEFAVRDPVTVRDEDRIGTARGAIRGGQGGQTMLRYDQHRELSPPASSTLRIGPWFSNIGLTLSGGYRYARFRGRVVDILEGTRRGEILESGSEFPLSATLAVNNYIILTRKLDLSLNLRMSYFYYPLATQADQFFVDLTDEGIYGTFSTQVHPTRDSRILFYDDIWYVTDFVDRRGISDRLGGREYRALRNTAGADWDWRASFRDTLSASISRSDTLPQSEGFDNQRVVRYAEMAAYRRQVNPFAVAGLLLQASQNLAHTEERPDSYIHGYSIFTGLNVTRTLDFSASVGHQFAVVQGGPLADARRLQSLTWSTVLDHDLQQGRSQHLHARRTLVEAFAGGMDITDAFGYRLDWSGTWLPGNFASDYMISDPQGTGRNSYHNWDNQIEVRIQLTPIVPLSLSASYAMRVNEISGQESAVADELEISNDYQTLRVAARTGFRIMKKVSITGYVQHAQRISDNPELAYTLDTVGVQLTWMFQF